MITEAITALGALGSALGGTTAGTALTAAGTAIEGSKIGQAAMAIEPIASKVASTLNQGNQGGGHPVQAGQVANNQPVAQFGNDVSSDERLKKILKTEDPVDCFAQINSYVYKYTPEARSMYGDEAQGGTVNGDENFGVMAQELQKNPLTQAAVKQDENGYLMLDGGRLSSINTAMIAELCKKVQELEKVVYGRR